MDHKLCCYHNNELFEQTNEEELHSFEYMVDFANLTGLVKGVANTVVRDGGIVRGIQNHGIRDLPHRFKARHPDLDGNRYFKRGRFVSIYYDSKPQCMHEVMGLLRMNDEVLRHTHLKVRNKIWDVNIDKVEKNPYIQKVLQMEREAKEIEKKDESI